MYYSILILRKLKNIMANEKTFFTMSGQTNTISGQTGTTSDQMSTASGQTD